MAPSHDNPFAAPDAQPPPPPTPLGVGGRALTLGVTHVGPLAVVVTLAAGVQAFLTLDLAETEGALYALRLSGAYVLGLWVVSATFAVATAAPEEPRVLRALVVGSARCGHVALAELLWEMMVVFGLLLMVVPGIVLGMRHALMPPAAFAGERWISTSALRAEGQTQRVAATWAATAAVFVAAVAAAPTTWGAEGPLAVVASAWVAQAGTCARALAWWALWEATARPVAKQG